MCGIIAGFHTGKDAAPVNDWALNTFEDQKSRGMQGFGVVGWEPGLKPQVLRATEPAKFMYDMHAKQWPMMLVHHRTPTSTENKIKQTHPLHIRNALLTHDYLVIHNGVISNNGDLYTKHCELGFQYQTEILFDKVKNTVKFNDSETFAIELAMYIEKQTKLIRTKGSAAFIALQLNKESGEAEHIFFGRNDRNPLKMGKSRNKLHLSSEGEGVNIEPFVLYSCKPVGDMKLTKQALMFEPVYVTPVLPTTTVKPPYSYGSLYPLKTVTAPVSRAEIEQMSDAEFHSHISGGGYDEPLSDFPEEGFNDILQAACTDVDDIVVECLDAYCDPDTIDSMPTYEILKRIRTVLEQAKEMCRLEHTGKKVDKQTRTADYAHLSNS